MSQFLQSLFWTRVSVRVAAGTAQRLFCFTYKSPQQAPALQRATCTYMSLHTQLHMQPSKIFGIPDSPKKSSRSACNTAALAPHWRPTGRRSDGHGALSLSAQLTAGGSLCARPTGRYYGVRLPLHHNRGVYWRRIEPRFAFPDGCSPCVAVAVMPWLCVQFGQLRLIWPLLPQR